MFRKVIVGIPYCIIPRIQDMGLLRSGTAIVDETACHTSRHLFGSNRIVNEDTTLDDEIEFDNE